MEEAGDVGREAELKKKDEKSEISEEDLKEDSSFDSEVKWKTKILPAKNLAIHTSVNKIKRRLLLLFRLTRHSTFCLLRLAQLSASSVIR